MALDVFSMQLVNASNYLYVNNMIIKKTLKSNYLFMSLYIREYFAAM